MKYIEELAPGDCFEENNSLYLVTCDYKSRGDKLCFCLSTGLPKWFGASTIVRINPIYSLDENNNIVPVKETKKHDSDNNIS